MARIQVRTREAHGKYILSARLTGCTGPLHLSGLCALLAARCVARLRRGSAT
jgi:hypothetical protein